METPSKSEHHPKLKTLRAQIAVVVLISILLFALGRFWVSSQYSNEALVSKFYIPMDLPEQVDQNTPLLEAFANAHQTFQAQQYQQAITQFQSVRLLNSQTESDPTLRRMIEEESRFNFQLARLADGALDLVVVKELQQMAKNDQYTFADRAVRLKEKLESRWRAWI